MSCLETYVVLRIFSQTLDPEEITRVLGIAATQTRPMEPDSRYRPRREYHYWNWSTDSRVSSLNSLDHVRAVIELLKGKEQQLEQLRARGCQIDVWCHWVSSGQGGHCLDVPALAALAHLGLEIGWDIYFGTSDEYADSTTGDAASGA